MNIDEIRGCHEAHLLSLPHVVGVGCGTKVVRGVDTGQPCVAVLVREKLPPSYLAAHEVVPPLLEGVATDVVEVGEVMALAMTQVATPPPSPALALGLEAHRRRHRPLLGGVSCGPTNFALTGTVGLPLVYKDDGSACLLSNTHVIAPYWFNQGMRPEWYEKYGIRVGAPIRQPSLADGDTTEDYAAELLEWAEIGPDGPSSGSPKESGVLRTGQAPNDMDAAVARLIGEARPELLGLGGYRGVAEPEPGMLVQKSGRTSGVTEGRVAYTDLAIRVGYPFGEALFTGQVGIEPAVLNPGDSGAVIVSGDRVVALGFAGSRVLSVATPMGKVLERFGLRLTPPGTPVEEALAPILDSVSVVWGFDNRTKAWRVYDPRAAQGSTLRALRDGDGYWIELHEDAVLTHMGRQQPLYAGWNLVGWKE